MIKTLIRLSDGRELIFYDEHQRDRTSLADGRGLPEVSISSEIRHDPILDEWVVIASHRQTRTFLPPADECPLCPSRGDLQTEIPAADYDLVVFENRFPSLTTAAMLPREDIAVDPDLVMRGAGFGRCEVVVFTSDHDVQFSELPVARIRNVVDVWCERTTALSAIDGVAQVFPFENCGEAIGVTLSHPHGQICAYPFVTPRTRTMLDSARRYRDTVGGNLFAAVLASEQQAGDRVVLANDHWTAFVPSAARWPIEVHVYPHRQMPDLPELSVEERDSFATIYKDLLQRLDGLFDRRLPYIAAWHQAPVDEGRDLAYLHLEIFSVQRSADKLKYLAGSESAMGAFISDVTPEQMAQRLREVGR